MPKALKYTSNPEFAAALGMHATMVSRLRNGHRSPSLPTFAKIVVVLECTPLQVARGLQACRVGGSEQATWFAQFVRAGTPSQAASSN